MKPIDVLMTVIFLLAISGYADAGKKEISKSQVPREVIAAFEKTFPNARDVTFEEEMFRGKIAYEVEYKENGKKYASIYDREGMLVQKEEEINVANLPEPVIETIKKAHPTAKIENAEKLTEPDATLTGYEIEIQEYGKKSKIKIELDSDGNVMPMEISDDPVV